MNNIAYVIRKNGKLLSGLFCEPLKFEATKPRDAYVYSIFDIAQDIATKQSAEVVTVVKINFPFGDWQIVGTHFKTYPENDLKIVVARAFKGETHAFRILTDNYKEWKGCYTQLPENFFSGGEHVA